MQAEKHCLILAAGFGTRMGPIGTLLPKVMWPVFEKSLLEVQLLFAKSLGYQNIWINLHHQADLIIEKTKNIKVFEDVRWLREYPEILDIGGAIHHLASQPEVMYRGELLVLNADQVLWFTKKDLESWKDEAKEWGVLLINWVVNSSNGYNQVNSDENRNFLGVTKNSELPPDKFIETYSGNSLISLEKIKPVTGKSAFFDSVCNPSYNNCKTALLKSGKYWDFGTAERYWNSIFEILTNRCKNVEDTFSTFLEKVGAFIPEKVDRIKISYACHENQVVHLGQGSIPVGTKNCIVLAGNQVGRESEDPRIVYNEVTQTL